METMNKAAATPALACRMEARGWKVEARVRGVAGALIVISLVLAYFFSPWWLLLAAFVGVNLIQSAFSNWCLMNNLIALIAPSLSGER